MVNIPTVSTVPFRLPPPQPQRLTAQNLMQDSDGVAQLLMRMRERAGLSRAELARRLGISANSLKQYENGRRGRYGNTSLRWFVRFAEGCGYRVSVQFPDGKMVDLVLCAASLRDSAVGFIPRDK